MLKLLFVELTPRNSLVTPFSIAISAIVNDPFSLFFFPRVPRQSSHIWLLVEIYVPSCVRAGATADERRD
jgi:hypothetical protein